MTNYDNMNHTEQLPVIDPQYSQKSEAVTTNVPKFTSQPVPPQEPPRAPEPQRIPASEPGPGKRPVRKKKKGVFKGNMTPAYIGLTVLTIAVNFLVIYMLFYTTRFSAVSKDLFTKIKMKISLIR